MKSLKVSVLNTQQNNQKGAILFRKTFLLTTLLLFASFSLYAQPKAKDSVIRKDIILLIRNTIILSKTDSLNIKKLKDIVKLTGETKRAFDGLIEIWYYQAKRKGKAEDEAYLETLNKLSAEVERLVKQQR